jgi:hypothetical protein
MAAIKDLLFYILSNYPHPSDLSKARVTKLVYLADWKHAIDHGSQITHINWYFNTHGPFVWDVVRTAEKHNALFDTEGSHTPYGDPKTLIRARSRDYEARLTDSELDIADHVIEATSDLSWKQFINLIYSTYPVVSTDQYSKLDLPQLAEDYKHSPAFS